MRASPSEIACVGVAGLVVGLAHAGEHEDLVVHREPVEEREDHQRDPRDDRLGRLDVPDRLAAVALLEDEDDDPVGRSRARSRFRITAFSGSTIERNARVEQDEREHDHEREHVREVPVDGVHEVALLGRGAAERRVVARAASRARGQHVVLERRDHLAARLRRRRRSPGTPRPARSPPFAPGRRRGRAGDAVGAARASATSVAASRRRRRSRRARRTASARPAVMPGVGERRRGRRSRRPSPGRSFAWASLGLSCDAGISEQHDDRQPDAATTGERPARRRAAPSAPRSRPRAWSAVDDPLRHHPQRC